MFTIFSVFSFWLEFSLTRHRELTGATYNLNERCIANDADAENILNFRVPLLCSNIFMKAIDRWLYGTG